jgi:hypothetical protein
MALASCIYCPALFDPTKGEGDHVIAAALGEFRNDIRFRGACPACNQRIGKSEQVLLHCGPEAFFRRVVNPALPSSRKRGRAYVKGAMGVPGLSHTIDREDHQMLVLPSVDDPQRVVGVDQLVIQDSKGDEHHFRLFPNMNADALKRDILNTIAPPPIPKVWLHCNDAQRGEEFQSLVRRMFPNGEKHQLPDFPVGTHAVNGQVRLTVNEHYWRSLAKIGFHYYLCHTRRGVRGDEPGFAGIRDFIINGGDKSKFFRKPKDLFGLPFGELPEGGILTPTQWCHILGANETSNEVFAYVHLFVGPACIPTPHYIALGTLDSEIVGLNSFIHGHVYLYDEQQNPTGKAGVVKEATVTMYRLDGVPASVFLQ